MRRLWRSMGTCSYNYFYPLLDDYMQSAAMDKPKVLRMWTWDDSTRIANFMTTNMMKAEKFGLMYSTAAFASPYLTKEEIKKREDELTEYFLYEMRKPASD